ncbi:MAG: hypothetical protein PHY08_09040 [Candidatus Cloacimonetes bacterium]|nr:hypothetical protein [Candidatus Cloacimonadota bacterium]
MYKASYGYIRGNRNFTDELAMAASQTVKARSGHFVYFDGGAVTMCADGATAIDGAIDVPYDDTLEITDKRAVDISTESVYEIPIYATDGTTYATLTEARVVAAVGKAGAIKVSGDVQYLNMSDTDDVLIQTQKVLQVVGYNYTNKTAYVKINPAVCMVD